MQQALLTEFLKVTGTETMFTDSAMNDLTPDGLFAQILYNRW